MYFEASSSCVERRARVDRLALRRIVGICEELDVVGIGSSAAADSEGGGKISTDGGTRSGDERVRSIVSRSPMARGREERLPDAALVLLRLELLISCKTPLSS